MVCLILVLTVFPADAVDYYVSSGGDDGYGFYGYNNEYLTIRNLVFAGTGVWEEDGGDLTGNFFGPEKDGRKNNSYGALTIWGASANDLYGSTRIYHNTFYLDASGAGGSPAVINVLNGSVKPLRILCRWPGCSFSHQLQPCSSGTRQE
ncbi:hypothetical protein ACFLU6_11910, partial [Acidobacteriota bacterium]